MTIRRRLASFISLMMAIMVVMGALMFFGSPIVIRAFRQSMESMTALNAIRELRSDLTRQRAALNRYLLLDDTQELLSFEEAARSVTANLDQMGRHAGRRPPTWYVDLKALIDKTWSGVSEVKQLYSAGQKLRAHETAAGVFDPLLKRVADLERDCSTEAANNYIRVERLTRQVEVGVLTVLAFALIGGVFLFHSLYRAVMIPLQTLRRGAEEFGKGKWDKRISISDHTEFAALANSFNTMAENVKQLQLQAVHLDRMSAVGQLAGGVAHEINNPLTAVLGQSQILLARLSKDEPIYAQITKIEQAALRCKKIVRGLLDFSRPGQSQFEPVEVGAIINSTLDLCEADLKRSRVVVERTSGRTIPMVDGNASELQQVFLNLINNSIHAMARGGTLTIDWRAHSNTLEFTDRKTGVTRKGNGPWIEIIVRDSGIGISKEHLSRVFEPFFTTKEIGKGTGLGLAVSLGILQKHGGDIRVDSPGINKGAAFTLVLPISKGAAAAPPAPGATA